MLQTKFQRKGLREMVYYIPNLVTGARMLLNFVAAYLFPTFPVLSGMLLLISVILDYFDGMAARKYNQCTFFGDLFDWVTDMINYAVVLFWWQQVEPQLIILFLGLFSLEIGTMVADIVAKCHGYSPQLNTDSWVTFMLKFTMDVRRRGYTCVGVGYWNMIFHFLCLIARVLAVATQSQLWQYVFLCCLPMSVSYVWMHLGYTANILNRWSEDLEDAHNKLKFVEQ